MRTVGLIAIGLVVVGCAKNAGPAEPPEANPVDAAKAQALADAQVEIDAALDRQRLAREANLAKRDSLPAGLVAEVRRDPVATWLGDAAAQCSFALNYKSCAGPPPEDAGADADTACRERCASAIKSGLSKLVGDAQKSCELSFVAKAATVECAITWPPLADPKGDGSGVTQGLRDGIQSECTAACFQNGPKLVADAKERDKATAQGSALVLTYKRCMLATDRTHQAIQYRLYDSALYQDLMGRTDAKCRASNRCDWLERYSDEYACAYGD